MRSVFARVAAVAAAAVLVLVTVAGTSQAGHDEEVITNLSGCLTPGGDFKNMTIGDSPSKPCGSNDRVIHLSSGDITSVVAGGGLSGGAAEGDAQLSLASGYALPQGCSTGQVAKSAAGTWQCAADNDTTYTAGTGLDLSSDQFSIEPGYRLPQSCLSGRVAKATGSNSWTCALDNDTTYDGSDFFTSGQACAPGQVVTGVTASGHATCAADKDTTYSGANFAKSGASCPAGKYVSGVNGSGDLICADLPAAAAPTLSVVTVTDQVSFGALGSGRAKAACPAGYQLVGGGWASFNAPVDYAGYYQFDGGNTYSVSSGISAIGGSVSSRAFCARIS